VNSHTYKRFNDPAKLLLFCLALLGLFEAWSYAQQNPGLDYYVTWTVVDATRNDSGYSIYDLRDQKRMSLLYRSKALSEGKTSRRAIYAKFPVTSVTASPFLYTTVNMLSTSNYETSLKIWNALSLFGFSAAILLFCNLLGLSRSASLVLLVPSLIGMSAFFSDLRLANIDSIQLGLLALVFYLLSRDSKAVYLFCAAALIAMLALLKLNLAPISLLLLGAWLIQGHRRKFLLGLVGMAVGALFAFGVSSLFFGDVGIWYEWLDRLLSLSRVSQTVIPFTDGNYSLLGSLGVDLSLTGKIALAFALCALILSFMWWGRRAGGQTRDQSPEARRERELIEYAQLIAMGCLPFLLVSPLVWLHYYVWVIPMLIVTFRPWSRPPAHGTLAILLLRVLPSLILIASLQGPHWSLLRDNYVAGRTIASMSSAVLLFALGLWQLRFQDDRLPGY